MKLQPHQPDPDDYFEEYRETKECDGYIDLLDGRKLIISSRDKIKCVT